MFTIEFWDDSLKEWADSCDSYNTIETARGWARRWKAGVFTYEPPKKVRILSNGVVVEELPDLT